MRIKSIRLCGFKGFRSGMGVDEVFIDFSALPDGLIAICGANGAGKTTLLDNLTPYRIQPFKIRKAREWSPAAFSYYDQCFGSDACKEFIFEMAGVSYRSLILIDADRRKQEAYLYRALSDGAWDPLNDGKVKTYDEAVEAVCGSPSLFFTSVFRCQGAKSLSDLTRGDIMVIISELLNIDHIREQGDKCRYVVSSLLASQALVKSRIEVLLSESGEVLIASLVDGIASRELTIDDHRLRLAGHNVSLDRVRSEISSISQQQAAQDSENQRLKLLQEQLVAGEARLRSAQVDFDKASVDFDIRENYLRGNHAKQVEDLDQRIARAEKIVTGADGIRSAAIKEPDLTSAIASGRSELSRYVIARDDVKSKIAVIEREVAGLDAEIKALDSSVSKLDGLDCHGDGTGWLNPHCRFIADAVSGRDLLPEKVATRNLLYANGIASCNELTEAEALVIKVGDGLAALEKELVDCQRFTRLLPELEQAEANLVEWRAGIADIHNQFEADLAAIVASRSAAVENWSFNREVMVCSVEDIKRAIAAFPPVGCDFAGLLRSLSIEEQTALTAISGAEAYVRTTELDIVSLQTKLEIARSKSGEIKKLQDEAGRYAEVIAKYSLLMKACSNDGIIALELDDASPSIAAVVNDLLRACYGTRFSVRLDTQTAKVSGDMKESFDIVILDSETGDERSITECSGGQVTVIEDAITRGICLYNIHRSDRGYDTLYSDEKDGALDEFRKIEFMKVKREALRIGTHSREIFITQTQDLVDMADARIVLAPGGIIFQ